MYISGSFEDFERRLHHLGHSTGDLASFRLEAQNYTSVTGNQRYKWEKEYKSRLRDWSASLFD